jgi:polyhydroxybutyrate depolymerase
MKPFRLCIALCVSLLAGSFPSCARANSQGSLSVDNRKRTYELHVPPAYSTAKAAPLVLALHGRLGDGHGTAGLTHFDRVSDEHGFLVAYPDGLNRSWADGRNATDSDKEGVNDVKFVSMLIEQLESTYKIDKTRIYVIGISNGGFMTHRLACELSEQVAAAASVAATIGENTAAGCHPAKPVSMAIFMGTKDPLVRIQGGPMGRNGSHGTILSLQATAEKWIALNRCAAKPGVNEIPDKANDGTSIHVETVSNCKSNSEVVTYKVENGGHTWPGGKQYLPAMVIGKTTRNLDASEELWIFFLRHTR